MTNSSPRFSSKLASIIDLSPSPNYNMPKIVVWKFQGKVVAKTDRMTGRSLLKKRPTAGSSSTNVLTGRVKPKSGKSNNQTASGRTSSHSASINTTKTSNNSSMRMSDGSTPPTTPSRQIRKVAKRKSRRAVKPDPLSPIVLASPQGFLPRDVKSKPNDFELRLLECRCEMREE
jgi:hypothetical protein